MKRMFLVVKQIEAYVLADSEREAELTRICESGADVTVHANEISTLAKIPKHWHTCLPFGDSSNDQRTVERIMNEVEEAQRLADIAAREAEAQLPLPIA